MQPFTTEEFLRHWVARLSRESVRGGFDLIYERLWRGERESEFETARRTPEGHELRVRISVACAPRERDVRPRPEREDEPTRRAQLLRLLEDFTLALKEASTPEEALGTAVRQVCEHLGWQIGHVYRASEDYSPVMESTDIWHIEPGLEIDLLVEQTLRTRFPSGVGLVGRVMEIGEPVMVADLTAEPEWKRLQPSGVQLRSAAFFPIRVGDRVRAVLEFFTRHPIVEHPDLQRVMQNLGMQLGHFLKEKEVERWITELAEEEHRMIGRELHDVIGQQIAAIGMLGQTLRRKLEKRAAPEATDVERLLESIEEAKRDVRRLAEGLVVPRPTSDLAEALGGIVEQSARVYSIGCNLQYAADVPRELGVATSHLLRIAQEAIRNAVEHGRASRVGVVVSLEGDRVLMAIEDDGVGFPDGHAREGAGFIIMRQRAELMGGEIALERSATGGVRVVCRVPRGKWG